MNTNTVGWGSWSVCGKAFGDSPYEGFLIAYRDLFPDFNATKLLFLY